MPAGPQRTDAERAELLAYWRLYEAHRSSIFVDVRRAASLLAGWQLYAGSAAPHAGSAYDEYLTALQGDAIVRGDWEPYLTALREQGTELARAGVSLTAWLEVVATFREVVRDRLVEAARADLSEAALAGRGLHRMLDISIASIAEAYLAMKELLLARSQDLYRAMFERSPLPMWMFDKDTLQFISVNEAAVRLYGYSTEQFARMTLADIRAEDDLDAVRRSLREPSSPDRPRIWQHRKADGTVIAAEVVGNDFALADGRVVRLALINDVSMREAAARKLRETEELLQRAQKLEAVGRLAGGVAHDFNNILTVVDSYACMLEEALAGQETLREDACEIRRAAERAKEITRQLLAVGRHSTYAPRSVDLDELVAKFMPMLRRLVGEQVVLTVRRGGVPTVLVDPGRVEQVIMNLVVNARDAMPSGGQLTIETEAVELDAEEAAPRGLAPGRYIVLAVSDTGTGMDEATKARIFDPFYTTKEPGRGTGLGLSIVHGIVAQAGGTVTAYSELGHGSTFRVYLPLSDEHVAPPERTTLEAPTRLPPATVLVVDDHADVRTVAARILTDAGCQVLEAASGNEALHLCVTHDGSIDAVLVDVVLGDGRGDVLVERVRELRPHAAVVLMSGYPGGALAARGSTPAHLLAKPFTPAALRAELARALGATSEQASAASHAERRGVTRVLVADDEAVLRTALARALRKAGFEVIEAPDGAQAMVAIENAPFDVVLSDVHMPGLGGLDLMRAIRRVDLDVPIVLMSGSPDVASATAAIEYGALRYLTKPVDIDALPKLVQHAARVHALARLRRQAFTVTGVQPGAADRAGLEVRFEAALDQLWIAQQPIFDAKTGALYGFEALVRSREVTMASPLALLEAATQLTRLPRLGRRVRALAATALASRDDDTLMFVNLHPEELLDVDLIAATAPLTRHARRVVLEVTERAALGSSVALADRIARLRELGFRIAVDDIGAGYSGLATFADLVPEIVKIDMSLVRNIHLSAVKQRTVSALCRLCSESGIFVVGEGVESIDERDCLAQLGCDLLQGYLLGRPT